jgi:hypothetical protein
MAGFTFRHRLCGAPPTIQVLKAKDTETLTKGDLLNLESGEVDLAATNDAAFLGVCLDTGARVDSTTDVSFISDADAVYGVVDANARLMGATLDIAGATGAMTLAASSNVDVIVVAPSSATEETLVMFAHGEHWSN